MNRQKQQNVPKPEARSSGQSIMNNETPFVQRFGVGTAYGYNHKTGDFAVGCRWEKKTGAQSVFYGFNMSLLKYLKRNFSANFPEDISKRSPVVPI